MPASTSGAIRSTSRSGISAKIRLATSRTALVCSSEDPRRRYRRWSRPHLASWPRGTKPLRFATRAKTIPLDPAISVLSKSKKAAPWAPPSADGLPSTSGSRLGAVDLDDDGIALAAAAADRRAAEAAAPALELVDEGADDAGSRGADRMPERDRAAVHVHLLLVDLQHAHRVDRDRREGLVDLPEVDVARLLADLLERLHRRPGRRLGEVREVVGYLAVSEHRGHRGAPVLRSPLLGRDHDGSGAVVHAGRVAGGMGGVVSSDRLELGERLERRVRADRLIGGDLVLALLRLDGHRDDLLGEPALLGRLVGELVGALGEAVHVGAGDLQLVRDLARLVDHLLLGEGVGEAVVRHRVDRLDVAHPEAEARAGKQVRRLAHRLHASGDADLEIPGANRLVRDPDRAHTGGADLVDGLRGDLARNPGLDLGLARGNLTLAGLEHLAVDDSLHLVGLHLGAVERLGDRGATEIGCIEGRETAAHLPEGGPGGGEDDRLRHLRLSSAPAACSTGW